ncbi:D-alanyl-D-alanine carboxypeptidase [Pontibacillus halophilus JSM 076056 = DSM 19796]|uniref:D-alanyl-D-alanine carboxypeptidase n=2 Tax=Pontibacillus TaxID=289201 RepID=A0A0A5GLK3_9BACI|nr:D-alanyl-D-alanine carboxypeptidase [Pontibacillus halophilus JSM 076056 = DSM 19796]
MGVLFWVIVGVLLLILTGFGISYALFHRLVRKRDPKYVHSFLHKHVSNPNVSLLIHYNDTPIAQKHSHTPLPLASTVKIMVAITYAKQAANGNVNPEEPISLKDLEVFHFPKTDGAAHQEWLASIRAIDKKDTVPLKEVAYGMMVYSSNANTDYLFSKLGKNAINRTIEELELKHHEPMYSIVGALGIPSLLLTENHTRKSALTELQKMSIKEYRKNANTVHDRWKHNPLSHTDKNELISHLHEGFRQLWSDRLPRSTTHDYVQVMKRLNQKEHYSHEVYTHLDPLLQSLMEHPGNRKWLQHAGQKSGSTEYVLAVAFYATDQEGNRTEFAFLADKLSPYEQARLSRNMNDFQLNVLKSEEFRNELIASLTNR